jgi:hypothetical protein
VSATATLRWDAEWVADRSGLAHSQPRRGRGRAACGAPRLDIRFAHPIASRCADCIAVVGVVVPGPAPITESEHRLLDGNR